MTNLAKPKACIAIPIYKNIDSDDDLKSLNQALKIFANHDIVFFHPEKFDVSKFKELCKSHQHIFFRKFDNKYFQNVRTYDYFMMDKKFYEGFQDYDFMLIYQFDAYVFRDELDFWCSKGIDFIGAPWFKGFNVHDDDPGEMLEYAGNGGFCLKNIKKILEILSRKMSFSQVLKFRKLIKQTRLRGKIRIVADIMFYLGYFLGDRSLNHVLFLIDKHYKRCNEDYIFVFIIPKIFPDFRVATAKEAIAFSFEGKPRVLYKLNNNKLPFGCHGWYRYSQDFWKEFIK